VTAGAILLTNSVTLGGSQSYTQTIGTGYVEVLGNNTLTASSITLNGDVGTPQTFATGNSLTLTSSNNGPINLNISLGYYNNTPDFLNAQDLDSFTANAGTGTVTVSGTGSAAGGVRAWNANAVNLTGAVNITADVAMGGGLTNSIGTGTLTVTSTAKSLVSGALSDWDNVGNNMALVKNGSATLTMSANNTYTGATTVNQGTLNLGTTGQLSGTASVTVNSGATLLLGGNNQINQNATLALGGTLSMGGGDTNRASSLSLGTLTLTANSVIDFSNLTGMSSITFSSIVQNGWVLDIYNYDVPGGTTHLYDSNGLADNLDLSKILFFSDNGLTQIAISPSFSGNEIVVAVPEPGVVISALMLLGILLWSGRPALARALRRA